MVQDSSYTVYAFKFLTEVLCIFCRVTNYRHDGGRFWHGRFTSAGRLSSTAYVILLVVDRRDLNQLFFSTHNAW